MNKQILKITTILSLFVLVSPTVSAQDVRTREMNRSLSTTVQNNVKEKVASKRAEIKTKITAQKKEKAIKEIDRRIESMNKMIEKISPIKRITDAQKSTLISQVKTEIANLTALKVKIQNDTDETTLNTNKKSIVNSYRIYALFIPKMTIIAHADAVLNLAELMLSKNPTSEAQAKIQEAKTLATGAISTVTALTVDSYPANKTQLEAARKSLQSARLNLAAARPLMK